MSGFPGRIPEKGPILDELWGLGGPKRPALPVSIEQVLARPEELTRPTENEKPMESKQRAERAASASTPKEMEPTLESLLGASSPTKVKPGADEYLRELFRQASEDARREKSVGHPFGPSGDRYAENIRREHPFALKMPNSV